MPSECLRGFVSGDGPLPLTVWDEPVADIRVPALWDASHWLGLGWGLHFRYSEGCRTRTPPLPTITSPGHHHHHGSA